MNPCTSSTLLLISNSLKMHKVQEFTNAIVESKILVMVFSYTFTKAPSYYSMKSYVHSMLTIFLLEGWLLC